jgi:hypothetical protein
MSDLNMNGQGILHTSLRQIDTSSGALEYLEAAVARHQRLHAVAAAALSLVAADRRQLIQKNAQLVKGSLNQFLSTPIRSDEEDVQRILADAFAKFGEAILVGAPGARLVSTEYRLLPESVFGIGRIKSDALMRSTLANRKAHLAAMGLKNGKWRGDLYATVIAAKTCDIGMSIDEMIMHCAAAEAENEKSFILPQPLSAWSLQLLRYASAVQDVKGLWEIGLTFPVLTSGLHQSVDGFTAVLQEMEKDFNLRGISVAKGLLPGTGSECYVVGVRMLPDKQMLRDIVRWFFSQEMMKHSEIGAGILAKEILFEMTS